MLTKRQQQRLIAMYDLSPERGFICFVGTYFRVLIDQGFVGMEYPHDWAVSFAHLTPAGQRLATILAELPAPLTRRQWQILLRFRDVGSGGESFLRIAIWGPLTRAWCLPARTMSEDATTNVRTMRILCDYGLIGFEYKHNEPYAHLTPLGEELVSLLP